MKIFLSYAIADRQWANALESALRVHGLEVSDWPSDFKIGGDLEEHFRRRIEAVDLVVPILTEQSVHSPHVMFELGAAKALGKQVIPVVKASEFSQIPPRLIGQTFIKANSPIDAADQIKRFASQRLAEA